MNKKIVEEVVERIEWLQGMAEKEHAEWLQNEQDGVRNRETPGDYHMMLVKVEGLLRLILEVGDGMVFTVEEALDLDNSVSGTLILDGKDRHWVRGIGEWISVMGDRVDFAIDVFEQYGIKQTVYDPTEEEEG